MVSLMQCFLFQHAHVVIVPSMAAPASEGQKHTLAKLAHAEKQSVTAT